MVFNLTRRGMLKFAGGAGVGLLLGPMPWTLLDDLAIWTQNRKEIPKLPRGPITTRLTTCTLCPAACGVRLSLVAGRPFAALGVPGHPWSAGSLCPLGLAAHQLRYHPRRIRGPVARTETGGGVRHVPAAAAAVAAEAGRAIASVRGDEMVAILDERPGRAVSSLYRRFAAGIGHGVYVEAPAPETAWFESLDAMLDRPYGPAGCDVERAPLIVSFGAPVLEGWGTHGLLLRRRYAGPERRPRIIQVEARPSRTALLADQWLRARPGSETALALGMAHVLLRDGLVDGAALGARALDLDAPCGRSYRDLVALFPPERVAAITGLGAEEIVTAARALGREGGFVVGSGDPAAGRLDREAEIAIWGLNLVAGRVGSAGGFLPRRPLPDPDVSAGPDPANPRRLEDLPDGSVRVLILDGDPSGAAFPEALVGRKLARGSLVLSLSAYLVGPSADADLVLPSPAWLEGIEEAPTPPGAAVAAMALSTRLLDPPPQAVDRAFALAAVARAAGRTAPGPESTAEWIAGRVRTLQGRGEVVTFQKGQATPGPAPSGGLLKALQAGGLWRDAPMTAAPPTAFRLLGPGPRAFERLAASGTRQQSRSTFPLLLVPFGDRLAAGSGPLPALASKLYRETTCRPAADSVLVHPGTAAASGLGEGDRCVLETSSGAAEVRVRCDPAVRPEVVHASVGPDADCLGEALRSDRPCAGRGRPWTRAGSHPVRARLRSA